MTAYTETDLNTAIAAANSGTGTTATFTSDLTETATPTTITAASGDLILDGGGESATSDTVAYTLAADTAGDAVLAVNAGGAVTLESLYIDGGITTGVTGSVGALTFEGDTPTATNSDTVNGAITGAGSVTVTINTNDNADVVQALILAGDNTYTGATTIASYGDLKLVAGGSIADSSGVSIAANGELDISGASASVAITDLSSAAASSIVYLGDNTLVLTETTGTFAGHIEGAGTGEGTLEVYGSFSLTATADTYGGATKVFGDVTLSDGGATASYDSSGFSLKESGATLTITNATHNTAIGYLSGVAGSFVDVTAGNLVVDQTATASFSGEIETTADTDNVTFNVASGVVLTLAGDSTYAGPTTIEGDDGSVAVTGSLIDTAITVASGGTLSVVAGGIISDAASVDLEGTLNISAATGPVGVVDLTGAAGTAELGAQTLVLYGTTLSGGDDTFSGAIKGTGILQIGASTSSSSQASPTSSVDSVYELNGADDAAATKIYGSLTLDGSGVDSTSGFSLKDSTATLVIDASEEIGSLSGVASFSSSYGLSIANNVTLTVDQTAAATLSADITGAGGLAVGGTATLTLAGDNTYSGATDIGAGASVALTGTGSLGTGAGGVVLDGTLTVSDTTVTLGALSDGGNTTGSLVLASGTTATIEGGLFDGVISGAGGVIVYANDILALTSDNISVSSFSLGASSTLEFDPSSGSPLTYAGVIKSVASGNGELLIEGSKTILTAVSTFTGTTVVDGAALVLSGSGSLAGSSVVIEGSDALLKLSTASSGVTFASVNDDDSTGSFTPASDDTIALGANTLTLTGTSTIDGAISGTGGSIVIGAAAETAASVATLTLGGDDYTYTGTTKVFGDLDLSSTLDSGVSLKTFTLTTGGTTTAEVSTLTLEAAGITIGSLSGETGTFVELGAHDLTIEQTTAATFSGTFTGTGAVTIAGTAALTLAASNALDDNVLTVDGFLTLGAGQTVTTLTGDGTINLGGNTLVDINFSGTTTNNYVYHDTAFSGSITGSGGLTVEGVLAPSTGTGTVFSADDSSVFTLSHAGNTFSGGILIENGTVEIAAAGAGGTGTITFNDNGGTGGALQIDTAALTSTSTDHYSFSNQITGLSTSDVIDLPGLVYDGTTSTTYANGILTVTEDGVSVALHISTSNVSSFDAYEDSHGGTFLVTSTDTTPYTSHYHP